MRSNSIRLGKIWLLFICLLVMLAGAPLLAQTTPSQIIITGTDASSTPIVQLHLYAIDSQGNPAVVDPAELEVKHDGVTVSDVTLGTPYEGGTFVIFALDIPQGVSASLPAIQEAIQKYATEPTMQEQVDAVAIYTVGELAATQLIEPTDFHNSVQNAFATPLEPQTGATALIDSVMGLLNNVDALKPRTDMVTHLVIMSDGTDVVSNQFEAADVPRRAAELGIPIHTVHLENDSLEGDERQEGVDYLNQVAAGTFGLSTQLSVADDLQPLWDQIAKFRDQTTVQYTLEEIVGGDYPVEVALASNPAISSSSTVTIPPGAPSIQLNVPEESRDLTLVNLDQPVTLSLSTSLSWLDGVDREVQTAQLLVNGIIVQELDPAAIDEFEVQVSNFKFGPNQVQIAVVDEEGSRAISPEVVFNISQGDTAIIPEAVEPAGTLDRIWNRVSGLAVGVGGCLLLIIAFALVVGLTYLTRKSPLMQRLGIVYMIGRIPFLRPYFRDVDRARSKIRRGERMGQRASRYSSDVKGVSLGRNKKTGQQPLAFLEVLESVTSMPGRINLESVEMHLGRSSAQADIVFGKDPTVSRIHATIVQEGGDYRLFDEKSTSGTFVNEQHVPDYGLQLVDGDEIRLGAVRLRFRQP
ncbi:MAG: FHA domain-containing protein [Chloroflexota bacterium]|jgi:hypothetical protein